jgi:7,8-dihydropterin-6-yl-methyl-4-(beta-D-ribofuranosyl)aminobenzene 5'-phosphate synthase
MVITVLTDNRAGENLDAEHGLSYLIDFEGIRLLFDTGQSNLFLRNARAMAIDMTTVDMIILSHGHFDHGGGLPFLPGGRLICHPGCFAERYRKSDHSYIGLEYSQEELEEKFELIIAAAPYQIHEKVFFLGEIPRITDFESKHTTFVLAGGEPDFVMDDSALAMILKDGLFVITGCGHSGIVNTLEHAMKVTGTKKLFGIMGGFHLKTLDKQTKKTLQYLKEKELHHVYPAHCTEDPVMSLLITYPGAKKLKSGDKIII